MSKAAGRASPHTGRPGRNPASILKNERGDVNYFSTVVFIFVAVLLPAFILDLFSIISTKQELDHCADQMVKQIHLSGGMNGETDQLFNFLCSQIEGAEISTPVDFSNRSQSSTMLHFGKVNNIQYRDGTSLSLQSGVPYNCLQPAYSMPAIINSNSRPASIEAIRRYSCSEYASMMVTDATGVSYENILAGQYKILLEPIAYVTFNGTKYVFSASISGTMTLMTDDIVPTANGKDMSSPPTGALCIPRRYGFRTAQAMWYILRYGTHGRRTGCSRST